VAFNNNILKLISPLKILRVMTQVDTVTPPQCSSDGD